MKQEYKTQYYRTVEQFLDFKNIKSHRARSKRKAENIENLEYSNIGSLTYQNTEILGTQMLKEYTHCVLSFEASKYK